MNSLSELYKDKNFIGEAFLTPLKLYNNFVEKHKIVLLTAVVAYPIFGALALLGMAVKSVHRFIHVRSENRRLNREDWAQITEKFATNQETGFTFTTTARPQEFRAWGDVHWVSQTPRTWFAQNWVSIKKVASQLEMLKEYYTSSSDRLFLDLELTPNKDRSDYNFSYQLY